MGLQLTAKSYSLIGYFFFLGLLGVKLEAATLCGGDIGYQFEGGLTYAFESEVWICDPTDTLNVNFYFGDGGMEQISIPVETTAEGFHFVNFNVEHTFNSTGEYTVFIAEDFLPDGLCNVPNSGDEPMKIYTRLTISPFFGSNTTPVLSPVWDIDNISGWVVHDLQAFDAEGDSLSYALASPGIPGFSYPNGVELTVDGKIRYSPFSECGILVLVEITEWRDGLAIQSVVRSIVLKESLTAIKTPIKPPRIWPYPNPTTSTATITWQGQGNYQLELFDAQGRHVAPSVSSATNGEWEIDMSGMAPGIYFGRLVVGEEMCGFKVVRE